MSELTHRTVEANGIRIHLAEQGEGPLVLLCHGFPESWYSWRHQMEPLSATASVVSTVRTLRVSPADRSIAATIVGRSPMRRMRNEYRPGALTSAAKSPR